MDLQLKSGDKQRNASLASLATLATSFASLATFNGDNLGRHAIFGLFESFRATVFCERCTAKLHEIQENFHASRFALREPESFDKQVKEVLEDNTKGSQYGIRGFCALNELKHWHVTENWVADLMHDFLEGVGPYEVKLVLVHLVKNKSFTLEELNSRISNFRYGKTDSRNKPSVITNLEPNDHSLKQNAFQFFCLFRLLPLIIGDIVPPSNEHWEFYLHLRQCADYLFAQKWTNGTASQLGYLWEIHQIQFKRQFPGFDLLPKHHFLVHYPLLAQMTGPPWQNMVAPQEMKGNFLKRSAHVMCNFKNVPHTLALRMQFFANNTLLTKTYVKDKAVFLKPSLVELGSLSCSKQISEMLSVMVSDKVITSSEANFRGQEYKNGTVLVLDRDEEFPLFGVLHFVVKKPGDVGMPLFVVNLMRTVSFLHHYWSFVTSKTNFFRAVSFNALLDFHPLDCYEAVHTDECFVSARHLLL